MKYKYGNVVWCMRTGERGDISVNLYHDNTCTSPAQINLISFFQINLDLDVIECFMTTFLHTHSWLNWGDEDD